ncbi:hypothetical protein BW723_06825 [Polaribacter reichenbachii]|uniref:Uncharacterized protein n=1 Tax=Polaribacter reichenbachii TaxID=996801 RepID=A0A1B8U602_9FLAO|nr:hypothetical protein BW723_06825 [Polaribacter reichenbachii]AUC19886.1 hypothetical protein BTO17_14845 [Polaribacter reichenbachii]OBY67259.1 hypothetical protein LPB301_02665 [Polaribacter reichenbachii]
MVSGFSKNQSSRKTQKPSVLVLPSYDLNANGGFSPEIQEILEENFKNNLEINLIKFPFKKLIHIPYQNVYDKKYCKLLLEKLDVDFILMSKIDLKDILEQNKKWDLSFRVYNVKANQQFDSKLKGKDLSYAEIEEKVQNNHQILVDEISDFKN